ncbi:MAG: hypothetical protein ABSG05_03520 [Candidatus Pacearchaeota archaeon]|jgi:hypothetical protein
MSITYINPLNLYTIFVTYLAGNLTVFIFLAMIGISLLAGRFRMPDRVFMSLIALFGIIMSQYLGGLYALMIVVAGLVIYYQLAKEVKY